MASKLRVAHLTSNLYGAGGGNRILSFARGCDRSRFEILTIVVSRGDLENSDKYGSTRQRFAEAGVEVLCLDAPVWSDQLMALRPTAVLQAIQRMARLAARLVTLVKTREIDVLDVNGDPPLALAACAARVTGVPVVATVFDNLFWDRPLWRPLGRFLLSQADVLVGDSEQRCNMIHQWLPRGCAAPRVIRNGITPPLSTRSSAEMRARLGLPGDPELKVVGQISRIMQSKGQVDLIDALPRILQRFPKTFLLLCGYPAPRERTDFTAELWRRARARGVHEHLKILSYPSEIADVWTVVDIHAHPSHRDSSPIAIIEGMALGKPAVVSAEGGIVELVVHGETGLVVPPADPPSLAAALLELLEDPARAARLGEAAQRRYTARHSREQMVREFDHLFTGVARGRAGYGPRLRVAHG